MEGGRGRERGKGGRGRARRGGGREQGEGRVHKTGEEGTREGEGKVKTGEKGQGKGNEEHVVPHTA